MMSKHWWPFTFVAFAIISAMLASSIPQAFAHPVYVDSSPKVSQTVSSSPEEVSVTFSEPLELSYSSIQVLASDGSRVDNNDPKNIGGDASSIGVTLKPDLPDDIYTVNAKVLSAVDGHLVGETFTFGVGVAVTPSQGAAGEQRDILSPKESASRYPGMVGQVIVVGAIFGMLWLWKPIGSVPWLSNAMAQTKFAINKSMLKLVIIGIALVIASGVAMIIVQAVSINAGIPEAVSTKFGNVWLTRMLQSSILMAIAVAVYRKVAKSGASPGRSEILAILILGLAVIVTSSLIAHAAATSEIVPIILDFFHNAAASIWIGGVILLGFVAVPKVLAIADERARSAAISILIPRFSVLVVTILGISVITGPVLLFLLESDLSLTIASVYGQILAIKLTLAGVMVAMGAYSQFVVQKKAVAVMTGGASIPTAANLRHYSKILKAEAGVGIALLLMVSLMANGALPSGQFRSYERQQEDGLAAFAEEEIKTDYVQTLYTEGGKIRLSISPFAVGQNNFKMSFSGQNGDSVTGIESASIKLTQIERGIGPITVDTKKQSNNVFTAEAAFSLPGVWSIEIEGVNPQGSNMLASLDANVKPRVSNLQFAVKEYKIPERSLPLYPVFDAERQSIWVGDTLPGSSRIWQLDVSTGNYTAHRITNTSIITQTALTPEGNLWYIDPIGGSLGLYNPQNKSAEQFAIPEEGTPSGLAMDPGGNLWLPVVQANKVLRFEPANGNFSSYDIPTPESSPLGIAVDKQGNIWFAEAIGAIGKLDPATGKITEYTLRRLNQALDEPTALFPDPKSSNNIYIAEHSGQRITAFNPMLGTFREYPSVNEAGLPFGMAMDSYGNLWFAEHQIDRVGVIDPRTGEGAEVKIPISGSFIQWLTSDDSGRIWFAAQRGGSLGSITITAKPTTPTDNAGQGGAQSGSSIPQLGFAFVDVVGPAIAAGIVASALLYAKNMMDVNRNIRAALKFEKQKPSR